jgi:hypothetical protein
MVVEGMATKKKDEGGLRGVALIKKAIASAQEKGLIPAVAPVPPVILKKLKLPNDEKLTPALKTMLAFDASWLGWEFDDEDPEFEAMSLEDLVENDLGEEVVRDFGEAYDILGDDCISIDGGSDARRFLYVGTPDAQGEYPVITVDNKNGNVVCGFVPFDVWVAQHLGALPAEETLGWVPDEYLPAVKELAEANGDGRTTFEPKPKDPSDRDSDDDDDDDDDDADESATKD